MVLSYSVSSYDIIFIIYIQVTNIIYTILDDCMIALYLVDKQAVIVQWFVFSLVFCLIFSI